MCSSSHTCIINSHIHISYNRCTTEGRRNVKENMELDSYARDVERSNHIEMIQLAVQVAKLCTQHRKSSNSNMGKISKSALLNVISFVIENDPD